MQPKDEVNARQGIGSLEGGLSVLELISEHDAPVSLTKLSELAQMSPSRLHKYLVSLTKMGYVSQLENAKYALSNSSMRLGMSALKHLNPVEIAFDYASRLHQELDKTITVTIWNGQSPLVVKWLDSSHFLPVNIRLGSELSPFNSAAGRIFLAFLPAQRKREIVENYFASPVTLPRHMGKSMSKTAFYLLLDEVKKEQQCRFKEDFLPDVNVIGAPVFNFDGSVNSVFSLIGNSSNTSVDNNSVYVKAVKAASVDATRKIAGIVE